MMYARVGSPPKPIINLEFEPRIDFTGKDILDP